MNVPVSPVHAPASVAVYVPEYASSVTVPVRSTRISPAVTVATKSSPLTVPASLPLEKQSEFVNAIVPESDSPVCANVDDVAPPWPVLLSQLPVSRLCG